MREQRMKEVWKKYISSIVKFFFNIVGSLWTTVIDALLMIKLKQGKYIFYLIRGWFN